MTVRRESIETMAFKDLGFAYENGETIFEGITFEIPKSRAVWVRSPGGRGKSTLLRLLAGLMSPTQGAYFLNGQNVTEMSFEDFLPYRLNFGYGFDMGGLLNNKTLAENLVLQLTYHSLASPEEIHSRLESVVQHFAISKFTDMRPYSAPGSIRKLACVLRAFMHWPEVVFLDDPATGLKEDNLNDFLHFVDEGFGTRGLKQVFFTGENAALAKRFGAEEMMISTDWFTTRAAA